MNTLDRVRVTLTVFAALFAARDLVHLLFYGYYLPYYTANTSTFWLMVRMTFRWQLGGKLIRTGYPRLATIVFFEFFWAVADVYFAPYMMQLAKGGDFTLSE